MREGKMICGKFREDGFREALTEAALTGAVDTTLRGHLAECAGCRAELERLAALAGAIDRGVAVMTSAEPSPGFAAHVRARVAEEPAPGFVWRRGWVPATVAGVAVLALAAWLLWPVAQNPENSGAPQTTERAPVAPVAPAPLQVPPSIEAPPSPKLAEHAGGVEHAANKLGRASRATAAARSETPALPEVLVSGDEWAQVVKLYRLGQARPAAAGALVARSFTPPEDKVLPFGIEFIQIKPLEATKPGEREVNPPAPDGVLRMNVDSKEAAR